MSEKDMDLESLVFELSNMREAIIRIYNDLEANNDRSALFSLGLLCAKSRVLVAACQNILEKEEEE